MAAQKESIYDAYGNYNYHSIAVYFYPIDDKGNIYYSPLLNTALDNKICMNNLTTTDTSLVLKEIYNSYFNFERIDSVAKYTNNKRHRNAMNKEILDFYQTWQDTGILKLVNL